MVNRSTFLSIHNHLYQTVIDLSNNEIVILIYTESYLINVIRTGIKADPDTQARLSSSDAPPFETERPEKAKYQGLS